MAIANARRPVPGTRRDRTARWLTALVLATSLVAGTVLPALAVDPAPAPSTTAPATPPDATPQPSDDVSQEPAPSPSPSPQPSPAPPTATPAGPATIPLADPLPTQEPTPEPTPTATPDPTPTPTPTPWPTPAWPTTVTTLGDSVKFHGLGYGHGVGMNQYGAKGRAAEGQTAEEILAAYFRGATLSSVNPAKPVRALVLSSFTATKAAPLVIFGRGGEWGLDGTAQRFPVDAQLRAWRTDGGTWKVKVTAPGSSAILHKASFDGRPHVRPLESSTFIQLYSKPSTYDTYRGSLRLVPASSGAAVSVVNHVGIDEYVRGVAPVEMPVSWPKQAVRAQVIAARSYAVRTLNPDRGTYDVYDDTRSQIYRGIEAERGVTDNLVAAEPGAVIRHKGDAVIKAFFFSTGGGATENNEYVFVGSSGNPGTTEVPYLRGIVDRDPYGVPYDADAPFYSWATTSLSRDRLSSMFAKDSRTDVGSMTKLDLRRRGVSGRLYQVVLIGSKGRKTVSADVFRSVYNAHRPADARLLRSNLFDTRSIPGP